VAELPLHVHHRASSREPRGGGRMAQVVKPDAPAETGTLERRRSFVSRPSLGGSCPRPGTPMTVRHDRPAADQLEAAGVQRLRRHRPDRAAVAGALALGPAARPAAQVQRMRGHRRRFTRLPLIAPLLKRAAAGGITRSPGGRPFGRGSPSSVQGSGWTDRAAHGSVGPPPAPCATAGRRSPAASRRRGSD
jgi:hypothetical protein